MSGAISSLGIGSGVLTGDVIDQLKEVDAAKFVTPYETKLELNAQKQESYELLSTYTNSLKANVSSLSYDTLFENKSIETEGATKVTLSSGASVESFTLETTKLAQKDITQFGSLSSKEASVATGSGVYTITLGAGTSSEKSYDIEYDAGTTLSELSQKITDTAGDDISSAILETSDGSFSLVLSSKVTGADQALSFSDSDGSGGAGSINAQFQAYSDSGDDGIDDGINDNLLGYKSIQSAQDAEFKYNGIEITRSSNEIDDLILGLDITLTTEGDTTSVIVSQDNSTILEEMESFVSNYNTFKTNLNDMTAYNESEETRGIFQGDSFIRGLSNGISSSLTQMLRGDSLINYGISIDRSGTMSFDSSVLEEKLNDDTESVKEFFTGYTDDDGESVNGLFTEVNAKLLEYTGYGNLFSTYETGLETEGSNLEDRMASAQASLDNKYDIMTTRFAAYDTIISSATSSFSSVQMMIDALSSS